MVVIIGSGENHDIVWAALAYQESVRRLDSSQQSLINTKKEKIIDGHVCYLYLQR